MGASALLIIFILLTGFISNRFSKKKYLRLLQFSGQHLYNKLLVNGVAFFVAGLFYCSLLKHWDANIFKLEFLSAINLFKPTFDDNFIIASVIVGWALALAASLAQDISQQFFLFLATRKSRDPDGCFSFFSMGAYRRYDAYVKLSDAAASDPIRADIVRANRSAQKMIFMADRKVYIGFVAGVQWSTDFRENITHCIFSPKKSGYREKDTLEVNITTDYKKREGLSVILKISDIVSIRDFSEEQFNYFYEKKANAEWSKKLLDLISVKSDDLKISKRH